MFDEQTKPYRNNDVRYVMIPNRGSRREKDV